MRIGDIYRVLAIEAAGLRSDVTGNRHFRGSYHAGQKPPNPKYAGSHPRGRAIVGHLGTEPLHIDVYV